MTFEELGLSPTVLRAVAETGYAVPTPIQAAAIPPTLAGRDILGIAQTGTGKTAAFALPMLTALAQGRTRARMPRSLIICPTRELAAQVAASFETYGRYERLNMALLIGGVSFAEQNARIDRGVDLLIATPGRLLDHFERGRLMLTGVQILVVDEADRLLDMGFIPDIERIVRLLPFTRQTLFFSATMPPEVQRISDEFLQGPVRVETAPPATTVDEIRQFVATVEGDGADPRRRMAALREVIRNEGEELSNAIVFCNRKRTASEVANSLHRSGHDVALLHGDLDQHQRTATLNRFRRNEVRILVASDVAARGLDIPSVSHVLNFEVPVSPDDYVHRIGRTARAGRSGTAITLCDTRETRGLRRIERHIGCEIVDGGAAREAASPDETDQVGNGGAANRSSQRSSRKRRRRGRGERATEGRSEQRTDASTGKPQEPGRNGTRRRHRGRRRDASGDSDFDEHLPAFLLAGGPPAATPGGKD